MKSTITTLFVALLGAQLAYASPREDCANTDGTFVNGRCACPEGSTLQNGKCSKECKADTPVVPAPPPVTTPKRRRAPKVPPRIELPSCTLMQGGNVAVAKPGEPVNITADCNPGTVKISNVSASCDQGCQIDGGLTKENRPKNPPSPTPARETFVVKPADPKAGGQAMVTVMAEGPSGSSIPANVTITWPAVPPPPPPPVAKKSQSQLDCEADGGTWNEEKGRCDCPPGKGPGAGKDNRFHFCVEMEQPKPAPSVTTIIHKGDTSHFRLSLLGTGLMIDSGFATGIAATAGGSWAFGAKGRWRFKADVGLMYLPTPQYQSDGEVVRNASGNVDKNSLGLLASGGVSLLAYPSWEFGVGVRYWRLGMNTSGDDVSKGSIEAAGVTGEVIWYFYRGIDLSAGLILSPMAGWVYGGESTSTRGTFGGIFGPLLLL